MPRCKKDGSFEDVQCSEWTGECWCVNNNGAEIQGTRSKELVTCSSQSKSKLKTQSYFAFHLSVDALEFDCIGYTD